MKRQNIGRILICFAFLLSIYMGYLILDATMWFKYLTFIYTIPLSLYFPICSIIVFFKSFQETKE